MRLQLGSGSEKKGPDESVQQKSYMRTPGLVDILLRHYRDLSRLTPAEADAIPWSR
jgi:hypothetical protein